MTIYICFLNLLLAPAPGSKFKHIYFSNNVYILF